MRVFSVSNTASVSTDSLRSAMEDYTFSFCRLAKSFAIPKAFIFTKASPCCSDNGAASTRGTSMTPLSFSAHLQILALMAHITS